LPKRKAPERQTGARATRVRPLTSEQEKILGRLRRLSYWLDNSVYIPIINYRIGYDALIGLIPGFGDAATLLPAGYIVYEAYRLGAPRRTLTQMVVNLGLEALVGTVPILGDLFDAAYKANTRNLYLLERHVGSIREVPTARPSNRGPMFLLVGALLVVTGLAVLAVWLVIWLFGRLF